MGGARDCIARAIHFYKPQNSKVMESFENFKKRNASFGCYGLPNVQEKELQKCYDIALQVEKKYNDTYGHIEEPRIGDIVEFTDGFHVYTHGKIVENMYQDGRLCICEAGSSHTDGKYFSTSGGAFVSKDKSELQLVGEDENVVWTWGCHGAGAHQGIYFPLKVRKWIIPYDTNKVTRSFIYHSERLPKSQEGEPSRDAVWIENTGEYGFHAMSFESERAFRAWARYVGYQTHEFDESKDASYQRIVHKCYIREEDRPKKGLPIKVLFNGDIVDGIVVTEGNDIVVWAPNICDGVYKPIDFNSEEYKREVEEHRKYSRNPMGV